VRGQFAHDRNIRMGFGELGEGFVPDARVIGLPGNEAEGDGMRRRCR